MQSAALCSRCGRSSDPSCSRALTASRSAWRGAAPIPRNPFSPGPMQAPSAVCASSSSSPASCSARRSRMWSPIAIPPRGEPARGLNTPRGRFWIGKSAWPLAPGTQLINAASWV